MRSIDSRRPAHALIGFAVLAAGLLGWLGTGSAAVVRALDLAAMTSRARHIAIVVPEQTRSRWDRAHVHIVTDVTLRVQQSLKGGTAAGDTLRVTHLGGAVGKLALSVPGEAGFEVGKRVLVFLAAVDGSDELQAVGMSQGVLPIEERDGVTLALPGGGGAELVEPAAGGTLQAAPGALMQPQPLQALIQEIRRLVARVDAK